MALERSSVAAALSKAACKEDVDCSSQSCISECTAWMDGKLKNSSVSCSVLQLRTGDRVLANRDFNFLVFPRKLKRLCSCFPALILDVD